MQITINSKQGESRVFIEKGCLHRRLADVAEGYGEVLVVSDENVAPLYAEKVVQTLLHAGKKVKLHVIPPGETSKSRQELFALYAKAIDAGVTRGGAVCALGGGVVGDLAGFAAATLYRGVGLIQIPTTLLSMVDSAIGGKTAINLREGKNLVGAFYQPHSAIIDPDCLASLPDRELRCGLAEVIKYALIRDAALYEELLGYDEQTIQPRLAPIIARCCLLKKAYVEQDTFDVGSRMELNFGHTLGHALEKQALGHLLHGEAVAMGMAAAAGWSEALGVCAAGTRQRVLEILAQYGLKVCPMDVNTEFLKKDKKAFGEGINVVLLNRIGDAVVKNLPIEELIRMILERNESEA
ncbi:MAG: 3-dehydroquinate synthase [Christensenellales bacterium]|jgi:3-dehydroquinate synthase